MSRREFVKGNKLNGAQSLAADFHSTSTVVVSMDNIGVVITTSGVSSNTGTFGIQVRIKKSDNAGDQSGWVDLTLDSTPTLANADASFFINLNQLPPCELRVSYSASAGANGTCDIWISGTSVGA